MLILRILLDLQTIQVDSITVFLHANIVKDPNWENMSESQRERERGVGCIVKCLADFETKAESYGCESHATDSNTRLESSYYIWEVEKC
jgi:hypothetical protein